VLLPIVRFEDHEWAMRAEVRPEYEQKYRSDYNYKLLIDIYDSCQSTSAW
jgi:hypothetical protein